MRIQLRESKPQRWRALILLHNGDEALLFVGPSIDYVRQNYTAPLEELFAEQHAEIHRILLQKWIGEPDRGNWVTQDQLRVPTLSMAS